MGLQSLPVAFGVETAKYICVASIDATQVSPPSLPPSLERKKDQYSLGRVAGGTSRLVLPAALWMGTAPAPQHLRLLAVRPEHLLTPSPLPVFAPCSWAWLPTWPLA